MLTPTTKPGGSRRRAAAQVARDRLRAGVVEAHPVDERLVVAEPEEARPRVPGLRERRDGPDLGEAEAQRGPAAQRDGVLVEAGAQPHAAAEAKPRHLDRVSLEGGAARQPGQQRAPDAAAARHAQRGEAGAMDLLGIEAEEERTDRAIGDAPPGHQSS